MTMISNSDALDIDRLLEPLSYIELSAVIEKAQKRQVRLMKEGVRALAAQFEDASLAEFGMTAEQVIAEARAATRGRKRKADETSSEVQRADAPIVAAQ